MKKQKQAPELSPFHLTALRLHLDAQPPHGTVAARSLGREVITARITISNLARILTIKSATGQGTPVRAELPFRLGCAA